MLDIKFKYERDSFSNEYILTAKIYFDGSKLYLWDTTIEEAYTKALQLADIKTNVEWDLDEDEEDDEAYEDEEPRVCRDECLEDYEYKYRYKDNEGYDY